MINFDHKEKMKIKLTPPFHDENKIKFCSRCGSNVFYEKIVDQIEYYVCEKTIRCTVCGKQVNYWSYGYYDNDISDEYEKMLRRKKLERICTK